MEATLVTPSVRKAIRLNTEEQLLFLLLTYFSGFRRNLFQTVVKTTLNN